MRSALRGVLRAAVREPATVLPAIALVAAAVGMSTAPFSLLAALLRPGLDAPAPGDVAAVYLGSASDPRATATRRELELLGGRQEAFAELAGYSVFGASIV